MEPVKEPVEDRFIACTRTVVLTACQLLVQYTGSQEHKNCVQKFNPTKRQYRNLLYPEIYYYMHWIHAALDIIVAVSDKCILNTEHNCMDLLVHKSHAFCHCTLK